MMNPDKTDRYQLLPSGEFIITDYNSAKPFASFFPGIAGNNDIPMWTLYVNRGQCVCSMGVEGKHHPIMEFLPANWAYNLVSTQGFRTFVKFPGQSVQSFYEPFQNNLRDQPIKKIQRAIISPTDLTLEEENNTLGLKFTVQYFNLPQADFAGLARRLTIQNLGSEPITLQVLDGLPLIVPYGLDDYGLKHLRRLFEAFAEVTNVEHNIPFFKLKVEPSDRPDVVRIRKGNFYLGFGPDHQLVSPIYDPARIFGVRGDYNYPEKFLTTAWNELASGQIFENRLPCAMGSFETTIAVNRTYTYTSVIGHASSATALNELVNNIIQPGYIENKAVQNQQIVSALTQKSYVCSSEPRLDQYARQNFLDNVLRGGFPQTIKGRETTTTLHLYSRKHGDLERDYNDFRLTPTPYSQGNGHFRDVNQNRRCDLFFNPDVNSDNIRQFADMIQLDGFNPLVVKETRFRLADPAKLEDILTRHFSEPISAVAEYLRESFTPGDLLIHLRDQSLVLRGDPEEFIGDLLGISEKIYGTEHGEGFWTDHWHYNLDLLENYLAVFPERQHHVLFEDRTFSFYDNVYRVQPRDDKYMIWSGKTMQLDAVVFDAEKHQLISKRANDQQKVRTQYGTGEVYHTTLFVKLLSLVLNKLASLDPEGVGVEMEADKPNWYDALNGLPGLLGSSLCETLELKRHMLFLLDLIARDAAGNCQVYEELDEFLSALHALLEAGVSPLEFWDRAASAKESHRAKTRLGISGQEITLAFTQISGFLEAGLKKIDTGIAKALNTEHNVVSSYFINTVTEYEEIRAEDGDSPKLTARGLPCFRPQKFRQTPLPLFLEGPMHQLRCTPDPEEARDLAAHVKNSPLYDQKLCMYKVTQSLASQPMEIGRARTFSPGWFENESVWLHMEYKYLLELLRKGLYTEFYQDFQQVLVPFMDPEVYGRSILENSSFIVSSANPDPSLHGNGFMARLSGATAEFISILHLLVVGEKPFQLDRDGVLQLCFKPALPGWLFTREAKTSRLLIQGQWQDVTFAPDTFSFMFLGEILVSYHNPNRKDTFGQESVSPANWQIFDKEGNSQTFKGSQISGENAVRIRERRISSLEIELC